MTAAQQGQRRRRWTQHRDSRPLRRPARQSSTNAVDRGWIGPGNDQRGKPAIGRHAGGRSILDAVEGALHLAPDALAASRSVLRDFGNMSSATLMFVLARVLNRLHGGDDVYWKSERMKTGA